MRQRGFTLIEMLIALAIFALIGVASYRLLQSTADASERGMARSEALAAQMHTLLLLDSEIIQLLPQSLVLNEQGLRFLRAGAAYGLPGRADLLRVALSPQGEQLTRSLYRTGPGNSEANTLSQPLALQDVAFAVVDQQGQQHDSWPLQGNTTLPAGIVLGWQGLAGRERRVFSLR